MDRFWPPTYLGMFEDSAHLETPLWGHGTRFAKSVQDGIGWGDSPAFIIETEAMVTLKTWTNQLET